ncbi:hypothetical protein F5884DRAFT_809591 [Xylogone sp. PMI_703]|nr:hypothetical protein F5884DRAFT_809591 [Xylogone sp. PMI_703]
MDHMQSPNLASQVCEVCRSRKKRCDKAFPSCSSCIRNLHVCNYGPPGQRAQYKQLRGRVQALEAILAHSNGETIHKSGDARSALVPLANPYTLFMQEPASPSTYPIPSRWYMPALIAHYLEYITLGHASVAVESIAHRLRTNLFPSALTDPCLFHALLYASSMNLDLLLQKEDSPVTIFHRGNSLRFLNDCLTGTGKAELDDAVVGSVLLLTQFEALAGNMRVSHAHKRGLKQIVDLRGGLNQLGMNGVLADLIQLWDLLDVLLNYSIDTPHFLPDMNSQSWTSITSSFDQVSVDMAEVINCSTQSILQLIHKATLFFNNTQECGTVSADVSSQMGICSDKLQSLFQNTISLASVDDCCKFAAIIHWNAICQHIPFDSSVNQQSLKGLKISIQKTPFMYWIKHIPEVFIWVCFVAIASVTDAVQRRWFVERLGLVLKTLRTSDVPIILEKFSHFHWMVRKCSTPRIHPDSCAVVPFDSRLLNYPESLEKGYV